jgi:AcrR family transcriptional regulator
VSTRAAALPPDQRRAAIVDATLPLLLERGANVSTRQIAEAAGIAEGTIFAVFRDKEAVVQAVLQAALDPEPTECELAAIDRTAPFEKRLIDAVAVMQRRTNKIWRLLSTVGDNGAPRTPPGDFAGLIRIFEDEPGRLRADPVTAARQLRALTAAVSNPSFYAGDPMTAREIVSLFLDGMRLRARHDGGRLGGQNDPERGGGR